KNARKDHEQTRKINFRKELAIVEQTRQAAVDRIREKIPRQKSRIRKDGIGRAASGEFGDESKEERINHHRKERLQNNPERTQRRLTVTRFDVAPREKIQKVAIFPEFAQIERRPAVRGFDDDGVVKLGQRATKRCLVRRGCRWVYLVSQSGWFHTRSQSESAKQNYMK